MYQDSQIQCWKTAAWRICSLRDSREPVKRLQRAIDAFISQVKIFNIEGYVEGPDGRIYIRDFESNPIARSLGGIDGKVGDTVLAWFNRGIAVAGQLKSWPAEVAVAASNPLDPDGYPRPLVRHASELAAYFEDVAQNYDAYYNAYKRSKSPSPDLIPPPIIVQTNQPVGARKTRWKTVGLAMAGVGLVALASWGMAKYNEKHAAWEM